MSSENAFRDFSKNKRAPTTIPFKYIQRDGNACFSMDAEMVFQQIFETDIISRNLEFYAIQSAVGKQWEEQLLTSKKFTNKNIRANGVIDFNASVFYRVKMRKMREWFVYSSLNDKRTLRLE